MHCLRRSLFLTGLYGSAALLLSSSAHADVIAKAGSVELGSNDIKSLVASLDANTRSAVATDSRALEQVVRSELIRKAVLAEAKAKNFDKDPAAAAQLDRIRDEAVMRLWIANQAQVPASFPSEDDIKTAYEANKAALAAPAEYRISQIFVAAPDGSDSAKLAAAFRKVSDLSTKVPSGDFAKLAREQSEHAPSAPQGGDLGFLPENRLVPEIAAAVKTMKVGEVAGPIKTAQGLHYIKLVDKKASTPKSLTEVHDGLANVLRARRKQELEQAYVNQLSTKLAITVNQIELAKLQPTLK